MGGMFSVKSVLRRFSSATSATPVITLGTVTRQIKLLFCKKKLLIIIAYARMNCCLRTAHPSATVMRGPHPLALEVTTVVVLPVLFYDAVLE